MLYHVDIGLYVYFSLICSDFIHCFESNIISYSVSTDTEILSYVLSCVCPVVF